MSHGSFCSKLDRTASLYKDLKLFTGVASVAQGRQNFSKAYGEAHIETKSPLRSDHIFPVASISKSFTAVAVHQLIEQGLIGWDDPASNFMRPADFGRSAPWCPRVHQGSSECSPPTIKQLLSMSSGLIDQLTCPHLPWESQDGHCLLTNKLEHPSSIADLVWLAKGDVPAAWWFSRASYDAPLRFAPGTKFDYSNTNYWLAAHIVESITEMPFKQYIEQHILQPAGLTSTIYDTSVGLDRIQMGTLPGSGYMVKFTAAQGSSDGIYEHHETARALALSGELSAGIGCSSLQSSTSDIIKWYQLLFTEPEKLNLTRAAVARLVEPITHIYGDLYYGQGLHVVPSKDPQMPYGIDLAYHGGAIWGYKNFAGMLMAKSGAGESTIAAVFSNRKLIFGTVPPQASCKIKGDRGELEVPCNPNPLMFLDHLGQMGLGIDGTELAERAFPPPQVLQDGDNI